MIILYVKHVRELCDIGLRDGVRQCDYLDNDMYVYVCTCMCSINHFVQIQ